MIRSTFNEILMEPQKRLNRREQLKLIKNIADINPGQVKFHCADCKEVRACEYAWDLYNTYGGLIGDTGCLGMK